MGVAKLGERGCYLCKEDGKKDFPRKEVFVIDESSKYTINNGRKRRERRFRDEENRRFRFAAHGTPLCSEEGTLGRYIRWGSFKDGTSREGSKNAQSQKKTKDS